MRSPASRSALHAAFVGSAVALLAISPYALLVMLPALVVAWMVLLGWLTGERAIAFVRRLLRRRALRPSRAVGRTGRAPRAAARGGRLLATSLASRPPPHVV